MASMQRNDRPVPPTTAQADIGETFLTLLEVAERLKINEDTVRRLFLNEPGVLVICFPRKGKRVYRTVRIPESVFRRVVTRLAKVAWDTVKARAEFHPVSPKTSVARDFVTWCYHKPTLLGRR